MEIFVHRLLKELIQGSGSELVVHYDMDKNIFPQAQYPVVFSEENTVVHYERELVDIERPLEKNIFLVGSVSAEERIVSYSKPVIVDTGPGASYNVNTHDSAFEISSIVRISMITMDEVQKQAYSQLHYMMLFAQQALRNPPTQDWWRWPATLVGFTTVFGIPLENMQGFQEELLLGKWFGAMFREMMIPSEHLLIRRI